MKTLTYQELLADCLKPTDANNNPILDAQGNQISFQDLEELKSYVVNLSSTICENRRSKKDDIKKCQKIISTEAAKLRKSIKTFIEDIPSFCGGLANTVSESEKNRIINECTEILDALDVYESNISILCDRFEHGKIRISSIGQARQGKSTFTQLYTGLDNELIPTNEGDKDTTGTVCVLQHTETETMSYRIEYYKEQEVLDTLNYYIKQIRDAKKDSQWKLGGIYEFTSINQLIPLIGKFEVNKIDENCESGKTVGAKILSGLSPYFKTPIGDIKWYNCLTGKQAPVSSLEEVRKHMLMYDPSLLYLATKRIDILCRFPKNGQLFQHFEVVDTKGGGTKAGLAVNNEILSSIQNSDAVFSVCLLENSTDYGIYEDLLRPNYKNDEVFMQKHFVILNPREGTTLDNGRNIMSNYNLCNIAYGNSLVDDKAERFSDLVVANMLLRIATLVDKFDKDRIKKCNEAQCIINERINSLCSLVSGFEPFLFDEKSALSYKVIEFVKNAREYIEKLLKNDPTQASKKTYKDFYTEKATLYELITNDNIIANIDDLKLDPKKPKMSDNLQEEDLVQKEITEALSVVYDKLIPSIKLNEEHAGQYIEEKTILLVRRISRSVNNLSQQKEIGEIIRREIFNNLWKIFNLNVIFHEEVWTDSLVKSCGFFDGLNAVNVPMVNSPLSNIDLIHPYNVLRCYFKGDQSIKEDPKFEIQEKFDYGINDERYINDTRLQYFLSKETYKTKLHDLLVKHYNQSFDVIPKLCKEIRKLLTGDVFIADECYPFYSLHNEILDDTDRKKIDLSKTWKKISEANASITNLSISTLKID